MSEKKTLRYVDHQDLLLALVTYFSATRWKSRTPTLLARDLALDRDEITRTLTSFRGLFRESAGRRFRCDS